MAEHKRRLLRLQSQRIKVFGSTQALLETCKARATALYNNEHDVGEALVALSVALRCRLIRQ
jgi:hypothetical protein